LGIKPNTSIEDYAQYVDLVDMYLIMTVEPGFGGQKFMENMMEKVRRTRAVIGDRPIWLQVDGGISMNTIEIALEAGADTFVVGSAVFNASDPAQMVVDIRKFATSKVES
jgi:ribulose-phosphate 3-epimerase